MCFIRLQALPDGLGNERKMDMKNRLVVPVVLLMFGAIVLSAASLSAAEKPEQDVASLIKALS